MGLSPGGHQLAARKGLIDFTEVLGRPAWDFHQIHPSNFHYESATLDFTKFD
jgi:hypothetical protein